MQQVQRKSELPEFDGPLVYRLGHSLFMAVSGVRLSSGLPNGFKALVEKYDYKYSSENFVQ